MDAGSSFLKGSTNIQKECLILNVSWLGVKRTKWLSDKYGLEVQLTMATEFPPLCSIDLIELLVKLNYLLYHTF